MIDRIGRYRIDGVIGSGSSTTVYRGHDGTREVAIKALHPHLAQDDIVLNRFLREARTQIELSHPSIVATRDLVESNSAPAMVLEYLAGGNLEERGALAPDTAIEVVRSLAEALVYTHRKGIVHRALRPEHVLFDSEGNAKLSDFGSAHIGDLVGLTSSTLFSAAPEYTAPELLSGAPADPRSDLFSLGGILVRCVTGAAPTDDAIDRLTARAPAWLASLARGLLAPVGDRVSSAARVVTLLDSKSSPESVTLRPCIHCRSNTPSDLPVCIHCGGAGIHIARHDGPNAESLVLRKLSERDEVFDEFLFVLRCIAGDLDLSVNIITGDIRLYSKEEKQRGVRLPVRIIDSIAPEDADLLLGWFTRPQSSQIHIYRKQTSALRPREKRGPLIKPRDDPPPSKEDVTRLRNDLFAPSAGHDDRSSHLTSIHRAGYLLKRAIAGLPEGASLETSIETLSDRASAIELEAHRVSEYLGSVQLGSLYAGIRRAEIRIESEDSASTVDEAIREKQRFTDLFDRYRREEHRYAALSAKVAEIRDAMEDAIGTLADSAHPTGIIDSLIRIAGDSPET